MSGECRSIGAGLGDDCFGRSCDNRPDGYSGEGDGSGLLIRSDGNQIIKLARRPPIWRDPSICFS